MKVVSDKFSQRVVVCMVSVEKFHAPRMTARGFPVSGCSPNTSTNERLTDAVMEALKVSGALVGPVVAARG